MTNKIGGPSGVPGGSQSHGLPQKPAAAANNTSPSVNPKAQFELLHRLKEAAGG